MEAFVMVQLLLLVCAMCCVSYTQAYDGKGTQCTDVLNNMDCLRLRDAAKDDGLTDSDISDGLNDAIQQSKEVTYSTVAEYLDAVFICQIFLSQSLCARLRGIASSRNVPFHQVELIMHANRAKGIRHRPQLYAAVLKSLSNYHDKVKREPFSCNTVLNKKNCEELSRVGRIFAVDQQSAVDKAVLDAHLQGVKQTQGIMVKAKQYLEDVSYCRYVMSEQSCNNLQERSIRLKLPFHSIRLYMTKKYVAGVKDAKKLFQNVNSYITDVTGVFRKDVNWI